MTPVDSIATAERQILAEYIHRAPSLVAFSELIHGITRRVEGAGKAHGNVGYSAPRDRQDAWEMRRRWLRAAGLDPEKMVAAYQTHGPDARVVTSADAGAGARPDSRPIGHADALIIAEPGVVAMTLHADCMPIILYDPLKRIAATIHAGWRGTVADVAGSTVRAMQSGFGAELATIVAYLGPAIGGCCYQVGQDVFDAWNQHGISEGIEPDVDRWRFDLAIANRLLLRRAGLRDAMITESGICTKCSSDEWFSHRGQGPETGRYGSFIALAE